MEKWKKTLDFLTPLFACVVINVLSGIFYVSFVYVIVGVVTQAFNEDMEAVGRVQNTFRVFSMLAAASCAPLMIKYGFRKVALAGSVILIFSCISSSLASDAEVLAIPFGFMGGIAFGLLRTTGLVGTLDFLIDRALLAIFITYICFVIGQIIGIFVYLFEMAQYVGSRRRWPNCLRILEVPAVMGLLAGSFLQKQSHTHQNIPLVFKHPPFYMLLAIRMVSSMGLSVVVPASLQLPSERDFPAFMFHPVLSVFFITLISQLITFLILLILRKFRRHQIKKIALLSFGILSLVLGVCTIVHQLVLVDYWPLAGYGVTLGVTQAYSQSMMPMALLQTTGRRNYKLVLPLLEAFQEMGGLIGARAMGSILEVTSSVDGALYYASVALLIAGVTAILGFVFNKRWAPLEEESIPASFLIAADTTRRNKDDQSLDIGTDVES